LEITISCSSADKSEQTQSSFGNEQTGQISLSSLILNFHNFFVNCILSIKIALTLYYNINIFYKSLLYFSKIEPNLGSFYIFI
jgi:hypothetical protein